MSASPMTLVLAETPTLEPNANLPRHWLVILHIYLLMAVTLMKKKTREWPSHDEEAIP